MKAEKKLTELASGITDKLNLDIPIEFVGEIQGIFKGAVKLPFPLISIHCLEYRFNTEENMAEIIRLELIRVLTDYKGDLSKAIKTIRKSLRKEN